MKKIGSILIALSLSVSVLAEPAKTESVEKLMAITGAQNIGEMMMVQMLPMLKQSIPNASEDFWKDVSSEMDIEELMQSIVPVYQQNLSETDVQDILAFYETPAGKSLLQSQPKIMQESMQIGQQWGQNVFMKVMQKHATLKEAETK